MKIPPVILAASLLIGSPGWAQEVKKISLDDASTVGLQVAGDPLVKAEGKASIRVATRWPTTVCLGEVTGPDIENAMLVYRAKIKSALEGQGTAFLEMWAHVAGGQYFSRGMNDVVHGTSDWKTVETPFRFEKGQKPDRVTLNVVINGTGTVWVDDIVLSREPLK